MSKIEKIFLKVMSGQSDKNIEFDEIITLLKYYGFEFRIKGSHHVFYKDGIDEIVNIQPLGKHSKPYQIKQIRNIILKYKLKVKK